MRSGILAEHATNAATAMKQGQTKMPLLTAAGLFRLRVLANGPFSYRNRLGDMLTRAEGQTFCASTYVEMVRLGWTEEL